jgi:hypothetical protein
MLSQITFQKMYGGTSYTDCFFTQQTSDSGFIVLGHTFNLSTRYDIYLVKTNSFGDTLWTRTYGGPISDYGFCVRQTNDGGFIITGVAGASGAGNDDVFLIKTDSIGNTLWIKTYGEGNNDWGNSVQQTTDGGYIIGGFTNGSGAGSNDVFVIKTNGVGDTLWTKIFGGAYYDAGFSIQQTSDGGFIVVGITSSFGAGGYDVFLIKIDSNGGQQWVRTFGGINNDKAYSVQQTSDGGYILCGYTNSFGAGNNDVLLIKTNNFGSPDWSKAYGDTGDDRGNSVVQTIDGGYILVGWTNSFGAGDNDYLVIKTNSNGDTLWTKTFGSIGGQNGRCIQQCMDGGFVIAGQNGNMYLIKTDVSGNSNCNQGSAAIQVTTCFPIPTFQFISESAGSIVNSPIVTVGYGNVITTLCSNVGIKSNLDFNNQFSIAPNPAANNCTITFPALIQKGLIEIFNFYGEKIIRQNIINKSQEEIELKNISQGIYFVKVFDGEKSYCKKIIVE